MNCENYLCIYQNKGQCTLDEIELDVIGVCKECIYIDFSKENLQQKKQEMKNRLNQS